MKGLTAVVALATTAAAVLLSATAARATPPGENGRIAYRLWLNEVHTRGAILTIRPNGTHKQWVTHPGPDVAHLVPDWSTDGRWIAYIRVHKDFWDTGEPRKRPRIFRIHPNGNGRKDLSTSCTARCLWHDDPAWSPNDRRIAFSAYLGERGHFDSLEIDLMLMRSDGTHPHHLTRNSDKAHADFQPAWAPSGNRLVWSRYSGKRDQSALFTIRKDGSEMKRITPWWRNGAFPDWSPNGRWILFTSREQNLFLIRPNGTGLRRITENPDNEFTWISSTFSPDGTRIVTSRRPGLGDAGNADVYVMSVDGSGLGNITQSPRWDSGPDWGPRRN